MTFLELARERWSVRSYQNRPIEEEKLSAILEAGRVAPTACNNQPQKVYVVTSPDLREKLKEATSCTFDAPVILVIGYDKNRDWHNKLMPGYHSGETDASIVTTHMMLEAWELGIGSCWVGWFNDAQVSRILDLPENVQVTALLPMGYPAEEARPSKNHSTFRELDDTITML